MAKAKIEQYVTAGLIAIFVIVSTNFARTMIAKKNKIAQSVSQAVSMGRLAPVKAAEDKSKIEEMLMDVVGRNPFKRQSSAEEFFRADKKRNTAGVTGILLTGIVYDKENLKHSYCIINGQIIKADESIDDFLVTVIEENQITLLNESEAKEYKLKLWED